MSRTIDNWERLVCAILRRQHDRELALAPSLESSFNSASTVDFNSRFSFDSPIHDVNFDACGVSERSIYYATPSRSMRISSSYKTREIAYKELERATKNFGSERIVAKGGYGDVYKGWINESTIIGSFNESIMTAAARPGYGMAVAVKKWRFNDQSMIEPVEWLAEITYLSELCHRNIVKLIGYGSKENKLVSVCEFAQNGSLKDYLSGNKHPSLSCLSWATRIKVAIGVARALSFLHDREKQVIHRNCTASNILLDEDFNAILSDFGLAMTLPTPEMTHTSTKVAGTFGYLDPEYFRTGRLTAKSDVYAFGVVLLELISGHRVVDYSGAPEEVNLVDWAKTYLSDTEVCIQFVDTKLEGQYPRSQAFTTFMLALQCIREIPEERPTMSDVTDALEQL